MEEFENQLKSTTRHECRNIGVVEGPFLASITPIVVYIMYDCILMCVCITYLRVGKPHIPIAMRRAMNTSTSFRVSGALLQSCARACGCVFKCSCFLCRYCCAYRVDSVRMRSVTLSSKKRRKKSIGALSLMSGTIPGKERKAGACSACNSLLCYK